MKKAAFLCGALIILLFTGCGQDLNAVAYNSTCITYTAGWVAVNAHSEITDKAKENETINIDSNGLTYDDPGDTSSYTTFTLPTGSQTLYGGFLKTPDWYAAVNMESVIIYRK